MSNCPVCGIDSVSKAGFVTRQQMTKQGKRNRRVQIYRCNKNHRFSKKEIQFWSDGFIEYVVYVYLRCLSLNTTIDIIRVTYDENVLSKQLILNFIETVADGLPSLDDFDRIYKPKYSGYLAFDGVWFHFKGEDIVLLVCFDPVSFDVIGAQWSMTEDEKSYTRLIKQILTKISKQNIKGVYGDGDTGFLKSLKKNLPDTPFQICVVHKEMRMGQLVPVKSLHWSKKMDAKTKQEISRFQTLYRSVIYADSKKEALLSLKKLNTFVETQDNPRFTKAFRSLKRNFKYTLTHFDHPEMMRDNNLIECFNGVIKPRLKLMKGFKKRENLNRYLNLFLFEYRFRPLRESRFKERRYKTPLELSGVYFDEYYNFMTLLRKQLTLSFTLNLP